MHAMRTAVAVLGMCALLACRPEPSVQVAPKAGHPVSAVQQLVDDLRRDDLAAYARHAVPPALHAQLDAAWREGRTLWPLTELPLDDRIPNVLAMLAAPDAPRDLRREFDRQFAGADRDLRATASTLGLLGVQYVRSEGDYSPSQRAHYAQLTAALGRWGSRAPLGDPARGRLHLAALIDATRNAGLGDDARWRAQGMHAALTRLQPVTRATHRAFDDYGLGIDAALRSVRVTELERSGDTARVQVDYRLAGTGIRTEVAMERIGKRWYLTDVLRAARTEAAGEPSAEPDTSPSGPMPPPQAPLALEPPQS